MVTVRILASTVCQCQDRCYSLSQFHHHLRCQTGLRDAPAPALLCRAILTGLWSELPPELVSHWATTTSLTWIMQMTLSSSLTKWITFIVPWRFLRQQRRNSAYISWQKTKIQNQGAAEFYTLPTSLRPLVGRSN